MHSVCVLSQLLVSVLLLQSLLIMIFFCKLVFNKLVCLVSFTVYGYMVTVLLEY